MQVKTNASGRPSTIELRDLTLGYEQHPAVHHLSISIDPGALVAVVGPNGAGKSTLVKALAGQLSPFSGSIEGLDLQRVAWLTQQSGTDQSFPISVEDMVMLGLWHEVGAFKKFTAAHRIAGHEALATVGLLGFEKRGIDTLSGGQMQRALFARLILQDAQVVLLDEPFASVDNRTSSDLLALLQLWRQQGKTVIAVLHDLSQVREHFPFTLLLARELVAFGPTAEVLTDSHWAQAQRMREAFDEQAPLCSVKTEGHAHSHALTSEALS